MSSFPANYGGRCVGCGVIFGSGTLVEYDSGGAGLLVVDCCGEPGEPYARQAAAEPVMPRGRKLSDRCGTCFQIPASNGVCGCS